MNVIALRNDLLTAVNDPNPKRYRGRPGTPSLALRVSMEPHLPFHVIIPCPSNIVTIFFSIFLRISNSRIVFQFSIFLQTSLASRSSSRSSPARAHHRAVGCVKRFRADAPTVRKTMQDDDQLWQAIPTAGASAPQEARHTLHAYSIAVSSRSSNDVTPRVNDPQSHS